MKKIRITSNILARYCFFKGRAFSYQDGRLYLPADENAFKSPSGLWGKPEELKGLSMNPFRQPTISHAGSTRMFLPIWH